MKLFLQDGPLLFAHRGFSAKYPENTMPAFEQAVKIGVDVLELDVRLTADDEFVVFHDADLSRVTNGEGLIREFSLSDLKQLNAAYHFIDADHSYPFRDRIVPIPSLAELVETYPAMKLNIDLKDENLLASEKMWTFIQQRNLFDRVLIGSFHHEVLTYFRKISAGTVATSGSSKEVWRFGLSQKVGCSGLFSFSMDALQVPTQYRMYNQVNQGFIDAAHRKGLAVHYWVVNDPDEMLTLLALGADGIMSDNPALLCQVYRDWLEK